MCFTVHRFCEIRKMCYKFIKSLIASVSSWVSNDVRYLCIGRLKRDYYQPIIRFYWLVSILVSTAAALNASWTINICSKGIGKKSKRVKTQLERLPFYFNLSFRRCCSIFFSFLSLSDFESEVTSDFLWLVH